MNDSTETRSKTSSHDDQLAAFGARLISAKSCIFAMQDVARELGDDELSRRVALARDWIEAADQRAVDLRRADAMREDRADGNA